MNDPEEDDPLEWQPYDPFEADQLSRRLLERSRRMDESRIRTRAEELERQQQQEEQQANQTVNPEGAQGVEQYLYFHLATYFTQTNLKGCQQGNTVQREDGNHLPCLTCSMERPHGLTTKPILRHVQH